MSEITNDQDIIDSRDVIERAAELAEAYMDEQNADGEPMDDDERHELDALSALIDAAEPYAEDWQYGATLIRDSYFEEYARELAEEIGAVPAKYTWPTSCIDWEHAARQLRMDYTGVDFDGVTYWVR